LDKVEYKWDDGTWTEYTEDIEYQVNGKHTLYARATDLAGNIKEEQLEVWFDFSNPVGTFTIDDSDGLVRQTIKLNFKDVHDPSGSEEINRIEIWVNGYKGSAGKVEDGVYEYYLDTTVLDDGDHIIRPSIFDGAGNRTRPSINITVDNTIPEPISNVMVYKGHNSDEENLLECPTGYTNNTQIRIEWEPLDDPDIDYYWFGTKFNNHHKKVYAPTSYYDANMTPGNNPYYYTVIAVDTAGNESLITTGSTSCEVILDQDNPKKPTGLHRRNVLGETFACGDTAQRETMIPDWDDITNDPSFSHFEYSSFNANGSQGKDEMVLDNSEFVNSWTALKDGTYGYAVRSVDKAGNKSNWSLSGESLEGSCQITYDSTPPSTPSELYWKIGEEVLSCNSFTNSYNIIAVWGESTDELSDVSHYEYQSFNPDDGWVWPNSEFGVPVYSTFRPGAFTQGEGVYGFRVRAVDSIGNNSKWSSQNFETSCQITYDETPPSKPENIRFDVGNEELLACGSFTDSENVTVLWDDSSDNITDTENIRYEYEITYTDPETEEESVWTTQVTNPHYPGSFAPKGEGIRTIRVRSIDETENTSEWTEGCTIFYDNTPPEVLFANQEVPEILTELPQYEITSQSENLLDNPVCTIDEDITFPIDAESENNPLTVTCTYSDLAGNENTSTYTVSITDVPILVDLTPNTLEVLEGTGPVVLSANVTGGNEPFTYLWSGDCSGTNKTTLFSGDSIPGEYTCTVTVTDADGDTAQEDITIIVNAIPEAQNTPETLGATTTKTTATTTRTSTPYTYATTTEDSGTGAGEEIIELEPTTEEKEEVLGETCDTPITVKGYIYLDKNKNEERNENEEGIQGITITILTTDEEGNRITIDTLETDENGYWETKLCSGSYTMEIDQENLPKNVETSETIELQVEDNLTEPMEFNIPATDTRNFWQKNWYWILIATAVVITIGYMAVKNNKEEITQ
ncbi:MAG: Conserved repeat domain protein, partial [candidate division WS6 bacterium 34_10]